MATLDEITKEKERVGEALSRIDAQREKLTSQLSELEAAERVLARYSLLHHLRRLRGVEFPVALFEFTVISATPVATLRPVVPSTLSGCNAIEFPEPSA